MNILFLTQSFAVGGVPMITVKLANEFSRRNHNVTIVAFENIKGETVRNLISKEVKSYVLSGTKCNSNNIGLMHEILTANKIKVVINQRGLNPILLKTAYRASKGLDVKFISIYHSAPDMNGRLQSVDIKLAKPTNTFLKTIYKCQRKIYQKITAASMRWNYRHSDLFIVLSPSFIPKFISYTQIKDHSKLISLTNPVTLDATGFSYKQENKSKEIIFVGRLDFYSKRVSRIINTWELIEGKYPDWKLTIIGDGPDRKSLEKLSEEKKLKHISFEGFQNPIEYYKRASILILTSEFEGFPLVLAESMSFGVIPAVYGSFSSVYDIITDNVNGVIIPYQQKGYDATSMANRIIEIISNKTKQRLMAEAAIKESKNFSMDIIYRKWEQILSKLAN